MSNVLAALGLTIFAGMSTGIGSIIAFFFKGYNYRFLSVATGLSAGAMLYVSFVEILPKGAQSLATAYGQHLGQMINTAAFFGGIVFIGLIDNLTPMAKNPHETHSDKEISQLRAVSATTHKFHQKKLLRTGLFTALAISIHNFPEGMATFFAAIENPGVGLAIAVAIALHNIPEGISVSVPIFFAVGSRKKAFVYSMLSGLAEPVGAAIAYLCLRMFAWESEAVLPQIMGVLFGAVAGIMVYISLDELLPASRTYGKGHDSLLGLVGGMVIMALSLLVIKL